MHSDRLNVLTVCDTVCVCVWTERVLSQLQDQGCVPDHLSSSRLLPSIHHAVQRCLSSSPQPLEVCMSLHLSAHEEKNVLRYLFFIIIVIIHLSILVFGIC